MSDGPKNLLATCPKVTTAGSHSHDPILYYSLFLPSANCFVTLDLDFGFYITIVCTPSHPGQLSHLTLQAGYQDVKQRFLSAESIELLTTH